MKNLILALMVLCPALAMAQFQQVEKSPISIIVTDGTYDSTHSPQRAPGDAKYQDPIRSLGMTEAIQAGAMPICANLPVYGEILGDCVVYVNNRDPYSWAETIKKHFLDMPRLPDIRDMQVPSWQAHFETVGQALSHIGAEGP